MPTYRLPTTGYVIVHTLARDGHEPDQATVFIDSAGAMDDATATAHLIAEAEALRRAPANVSHTLHLVHRTGSGDRHIRTVGPVRGDRPALP